MDNSALAVAIREQLIAELSKSAKVKPDTVSIGVVTDDCNKENNIVREGILLELTKPNNPSRRDVKDASIQTDTEESATNNHAGNDLLLLEIEHECEQRLRREMNGKLRLSAKQQAMQAHTRLERKHKDECRSLQKQLAEERSRSKHREKELLQVISQQQMSWQKELKEVEQKLEKSTLAKSMLESEMGLLNDRMKEFQITRFNDNEKSERALTMSLKDLEQQKRQFQIGVAEAVRERDRFQLMLANESELHIQKMKQFEQTQEELLKKLVNAERKLDKTESALNAKNSEVTALRALLKQCQSALESLSYKDESGPNRNVFIPQTSTQKATSATLTPTIPIQLTCIPNQTIAQEQQAIVQTVAAQASQNNIIEENQPTKPEVTRAALRYDQFVHKKHLGDPPPCTLLGDPPEEMLPLLQPHVQSGEELDRISVEATVPEEIELDSHSNHDGSITEESSLPMHKEQVKFEDTSQSQPDETKSTDNEACTPKGDERNEVVLENDGKKLSTETYPSFNNEAETNKTTSSDETSIAVRDDESSAVNNDSSSGSESSDDEYSMSFCTLDQKLDKQGRVSFIHIK